MNYFCKIDSTNDELKRKVKDGTVTCCHSVCAFEQEKGKGRHERAFLSPVGGIYYSIAIKNTDMPITAMTALVCADTIEDFFKLPVGIKWVNDIIFNNKKCAGVLAEKVDKYTIIGIGVNIYSKIPRELENKAISLFPKEKYDKEVLENFAKKLDENMNKLSEENIDPTWLERYKKKSVLIGKECTLSVPDGKVIARGVATDFAEDGSILLNVNGKIETFCSGEISLSAQGLYKKCLN